MARKRMEGNEGNASEVSEIKLQISRRETPTLPTERRAQIEQSYFKPLPFAPAEIACLALPEILAEKIRACYQRNKARDMYDLGMFAMRPLDQALIRRLRGAEALAGARYFRPRAPDAEIRGWPGV